MKKEEVTLRVVKRVGNGDFLETEFADILMHLDKIISFNGMYLEIDIEFVKGIKHFLDFINIYEAFPDSHWVEHAQSIYEGKYPLEKLPEHVRELAKELYYERSNL